MTQTETFSKNEKLKRIKERLNKITPAPWKVYDNIEELEISQNKEIYESGKTIIDALYNHEDADFIANAPEDIRFLLKHIEYLDDLLDETYDMIQDQ